MSSHIKTVHTENPHEVIFEVGVLLNNGETKHFTDRESAADEPLARALFLVRGISQVSIERNQIRVIKSEDVIWPLVVPPAITIIYAKTNKLLHVV